MSIPKPPSGAVTLVGRASWSLINQGAVSLGNLFVNIQLAWLLPIEEYGVFALLLSGMLALQVVNAALLSYPQSIRLAATRGQAHTQLLSNTLILTLGACCLLDLFLVAGLALFGRFDLIVPASAFFLLWQLQEAARRGLLADLRHRVATIGDGVTYVGQPLLLGLLGAGERVDLALALYVMAAACLAGALVHLTRLRLTKPHLAGASSVFLDFWRIGKWQLTINGILFMNVRLYPWALAYADGPAAAAVFQAMLNVANLINPLIIGLGNAIPQVAAKALAGGGIRRAWHDSRAYILTGLPLAFISAAILLLAPSLVLSVFYGKQSPYLEISLAVQIVAISWPARYIGDLICCFLIGAEAGRLAVMACCAGLFASLILLPFALPLGLAGIAGTMAAASAVLLISSYYAVTLTGATAMPPAEAALEPQ